VRARGVRGPLSVIAYVFTWLFVFAVPWEGMVVIPGLGTFSKLLGFVAFGAACLHVLLRARMRKLIPFHWVALAYLCWVLVSTSWAVNDFCSPVFGCDVRSIINTYLQCFVMLWVLWEAATTRSRVISLLQAYVLGAYVAAGGTIFNYATGTGIRKAASRFAATGFDANDLGMLLALALPMAWYISSRVPGGFQRWLNRGYFVAGTLAILLTSSRGALLATLVALAVVPWTLTQLRLRVRVAAAVIMLGAGAAAVRFVPTKSFERLSTTQSEITQGTMDNRLQIWKDGLAAVPQRFFQGYGPAGWRAALSRRLGIKGAHNTYLSILVEEGAIGLLLFLTIYALVLRRLLVLPTFERRVGLTLLATLATAMIPLDWDTRKAAWLVVGLLVAYSDLLPVSRVDFDPAAGKARYRPTSRRALASTPPATVR
jgi:O-antigen ligase